MASWQIGGVKSSGVERSSQREFIFNDANAYGKQNEN